MGNNNNPPDPPTHRTFVQRLTLPEVILMYYNQWQTEGNETAIKLWYLRPGLPVW